MATDIIARGMASEAERAANKYVAGTNINFIPQEDGTVKITASGDVSSEDDVARELINNHKIDMNNPHNVTAEQLGLGNVDNTSDISKPISKATQNALDGKSNTNHTHTTYDSHIENVEIHVTAEEKAAWNGKAEVSDISNPNLLINPDFSVNQRGQASYSSSGYTVDRWKTGGAKTTVNDGFITLENTTAKAAANIYQIVENPSVLSGKTVTLSFDYDLKTEGAWISVQALANNSWNPSPPVQLTDTGRNVKSTVITFPENLTDLRLVLVIHSTDSAPLAIVDIYGAKLELGSIATPIIPADPATELAKCQRYYQIHSTGDIAAVDLRPSMATIKDIKQRSDGNYEYIAEL